MTIDDLRIAAVENNLFDLFGSLRNSVMDCHDEPDLLWCTSDIVFPLFNGALRARFADDQVRRRTHEVLDRLIDHGRPFLWWLTPTTRSPELEQVLAEHGLVPNGPDIGMYVELSDLPVLDETAAAGITVETTTEDTAADTFLAMVDGFGMPRELAAPMREVLTTSDPTTTRVINVLARVAGAPAGAGSVVIANGVAGLYNIAVHPEARGRGVGRAITVELMRLGAQAGCRESILAATEMVFPIYQRVGYQSVCEVQQYLWMPPE